MKESSLLKKIFITSFTYLLIVLLPFMGFVFLNSSTSRGDAITYEQAGDINCNEWFCNPESPQYKTITRLGILSLVLAFGAIGSVISFLTRSNQDNHIASEASVTLIQLLFIQIIGSAFAFILMIFFWSGLIDGALFPNVSFGPSLTMYFHEDLGKLIVWSFIAGFSERLVPKLIQNVIERIDSQERQSPA